MFVLENKFYLIMVERQRVTAVGNLPQKETTVERRRELPFLKKKRNMRGLSAR
jgi:hypothetical protein